MNHLMILGGTHPIKEDIFQSKASFIKKISGYPYKNILYRLYNRFFLRPASKRYVDMESILRDIPSIVCKTDKKGYSEYFSHDDINTIKKYNPDFILRFGFNIIRGDILEAAKYGIWSFHHDDEQKYRGGPPGFWEAYKNDPVNGAILQRLTNKLDGGIILKKGYFKTIKHSNAANLDLLFFESAYWPLQVCRDIKNGVANYFSKPQSKTTAKIYRNPNNLQMLSFFFKSIFHRLNFHFEELFKAEEWNIGIANQPIEDFLKNEEKPEVKWMSPPKKHKYKADAFGFFSESNLKILFEDYSYKIRKGVISCVDYNVITDSECKDDLVISKEYHLSYPFIFEFDNKVFCIPESAANNQIDLYQYDIQKSGFIFVNTLLSDVDAVDSTLFRHHERWWMFFTKKHLSDTNLYIYFSDDLFGEFFPHKNNPVKADIYSARPAGSPFYYEGNLYRPAQDCSITYGCKVVINRIETLNTSEFLEVKQKSITPYKSSRYNKGIHTLASAGNYTIVDGKRFVFLWIHFIHTLRKKINKLIVK